MSDSEKKIADSIGKFAQVVVDGQKIPDIEWVPGRLLLSNKRLVLASEEGKHTIPLSKITSIKGRQDAANPLADVSNYLSLHVGNDVTLVSPDEHAAFEGALYSAVLDHQVVIVKHPAIKGGVVQSEEWQKCRISLEAGEDLNSEGTVALAIANGQFVEVDIDDVGHVNRDETDVLDEERLVIEVEHTQEDTAVETHLSGGRQMISVLASLFRKGEEKNTTDVDLTEKEQAIVMALYSGVSPFQIPDFVGLDVEETERIYDELVEEGILQKDRVRREVKLQARGRNIASEAMDEE